jgi:DNA-binding NtrC family response regulator
MAYHWPGNIRQLENAVFRAVVLADGDSLGVDEFPQITAQLSAGAHSQPVQALEALADHPGETLAAAAAMAPLPERPVMPPLPAVPLDALPLLDRAGDVRPLEEIEIELIRFAIAHYRGQMSEVARRLQIAADPLSDWKPGLHGDGTALQQSDSRGKSPEAWARPARGQPEPVA